MMRIGLFGYGKMGRAIETAAQARGHSIAWRVQQGNRGLLTPELLREAGLVEVHIEDHDRVNGNCREFQIAATRPG